MPITVCSAQIVGLRARIISVEVDISQGLHLFTIVGLADKEVQESRERISAAIKNIGALAPHKKSQRVIVNLAPADLKKEGPAFDVPIALGYLAASRQISCDFSGTLFLGELGLDGSIRKVAGVLASARAARDSGFSRIFVPKGNGAEAALVNGILVYEMTTLLELLESLAGQREITPLEKQRLPDTYSTTFSDLKDIRGQDTPKRALEISAAGGHNMLMTGPPGAGKTLLAQALPSILPLLADEESLEVTTIYSVAGLLDEQHPVITQPPFRNPHHTSSYTAVVGGGSYPRPGEVTLAHRGVLFLDEFPEFDRRVIEALRQPLEARTVTVARTQAVHTFPAHFMLVAAMNPCPCGNFGNPVKDCTCAPGAVTRYTKKISGPMLDRIDLHIEVPAVGYDTLEGAEGETSAAVRERVLFARHVQKKRFRDLPYALNGDIRPSEFRRFIHIGDDLKPIIRAAHEKYRLSARAYHRVLKVARTIADLADSDTIKELHFSEALKYRPAQDG